MEANSQTNDKLYRQLEEAYGRILYTYTCHNKMIGRLETKNKRIKGAKIILSALSSGGIFILLFQDENLLKIASAIFSTLLLTINLYYKDFSLVDEVEEHRKTSDKLWLIREKYTSLMTDFQTITIEQIRNERNRLQEEIYEIYSCSPKTDKKSYKEAQKALKVEEEQYFSIEELNQILPSYLREEEV